MAKTAKGLMRKQHVYKCGKLRADGWGKGWEWGEGQYGREDVVCADGWEGSSVMKITVRFYSAVA